MCKQTIKEKQSRRIRAYLILKGLNRTNIADILGVSAPRASTILYSGVSTLEQRDRLLAAGFPKLVLPVPSRGRPGPMRKSELKAEK